MAIQTCMDCGKPVRNRVDLAKDEKSICAQHFLERGGSISFLLENPNYFGLSKREARSIIERYGNK